MLLKTQFKPTINATANVITSTITTGDGDACTSTITAGINLNKKPNFQISQGTITAFVHKIFIYTYKEQTTHQIHAYRSGKGEAAVQTGTERLGVLAPELCCENIPALLCLHVHLTFLVHNQGVNHKP